MKQAKQRRLRPRNPVATAPLLKKGGPHLRRDKKTTRARQKARLRREADDL